MKTNTGTHRFIRLAPIAAAALSIAGHGMASAAPSEAESFGYFGRDLVDETNMTYIVLGPAVTNYVPERVITVMEQYKLSDGEKGAMKAAGVLMPGASYKAFPEGYVKETDEPWFALWTRPVESFGFKGVAGVLSHFDEDAGKWETSETYFSSYWKTKDEALAAFRKLREDFARGRGVKKFYDFESCWVAEYLRLSVMCVIGQKPDGRWSCMLDFHDKCEPGCGPWEDIETQTVRLKAWKYARALKTWKAAVAAAKEKSHSIVMEAMKAASLPGYPEAVDVSTSTDGLPVKAVFGESPAAESEASAEAVGRQVWAERVADVAKALGVAFEGAPVVQTVEGAGILLGADWQNEYFAVRLDVAVSYPFKPESGEKPVLRPVKWRVVFCELVHGSVKIPRRPERKDFD